LISKVFPHELSDEDLSLFYKAVETDEDAGSIDQVVSDIYDSRLEIFHWKKENHNSLFVTEVNEKRNGSRELFIVMAAGLGFFEDQSEILESAKPFAKERGCSHISAYVKPEIAYGNFNLIGEVKDKKERENNGAHSIDVTYVVISVRV
tara:strand:+ start:2843 stop:3289 length:447 start_codon:yes stop_codon:yes gene_type:complete